jgi:transcriptional regulator with XRE-family HTH domain
MAIILSIVRIYSVKFEIDTPETLGMLIRASRKALDMRQDDAAGTIGVSENFLGKVERGGETVQWGKLFQVIKELGLSVTLEVPEAFAPETLEHYQTIQRKRQRTVDAQPDTSQNEVP